MIDLTKEDGSYNAVVNSMEVEVLYEDTIGDYQGDYLFILKNDNLYGFLSIGYGSCSGCDYMEGLVGYRDEMSDEVLAELTAFRNDLWNGISWKTRDDMVEWLNNEDRDLHWYYYELGFEEFLEKAKKAIAKEK